jgi:serine/threonine-protein kinase
MPDNSPPSATIDLLAGVLALRAELITADDLRAALEAAPSQPPVAVLARQGRLAADLVAPLGRLASVHLAGLPDSLGWLGLLDGHPDLRLWVKGLLAPLSLPSGAEDSSATLQACPPTRPPTEAGPASPPRFTGGTATERYRRLALHATGGLGVVYQARDEELGRTVALKEIQGAAADHPSWRARFLFEAEVTGNLEHPGIVPVYGLGCYPDGRPFYAMRFIRGHSLDEEIKHFHQADTPGRDRSERTLGLRGLLGRFVDVCNALAYAHSRSVIHRDVKPANVMLGEFGETLVVDWGLARLGPVPEQGHGAGVWPASAAGMMATARGTAIGTPAYMPPEQATGEHDQVGPHSDVYSLGATLYHLLTGQPPFTGSSLEEILLKVVRGDCPPPRHVNPAVPAALAAVCQKAMMLEPGQRYPSAQALAEDVEHWLADEPVSAYREPPLERARRWARRHRTLVSSLLVLLVVGVAGLGLGLWAVSWEQHRTAQERDRALEAEKKARANLELARKAVDECFGLARNDPLVQGEHLRAVRKRLLEKTLPFYREFRSQGPDDRTLAAQQAEYLFRVAFITEEIGSKTEAIETLEQALAIRASLAQQHPEDNEHQADLAETWGNLAILQSQTGELHRGVKSCEQARALYHKLVQDRPAVARYQAELATTWSNQGQFQHQLGQRRAALESHEQARNIRTELARTYPQNPRYQADLATSWLNLGVIQKEMQKLPDALKSYTQARDRFAQLHQAHPGVGLYQDKLGTAWNNLGVLHTDMGKHQEALNSHQQARDLRAPLALAYPEVTRYQADLGATWNNLGVVQAMTGRRREALESCRQALAIRSKLARDHPTLHEYQAELAGTWNNLGLLQRDLGKPEEALKSYTQARDIQARLVAAHREVAAYQRDLADTWNNLGVLQTAMDRPAEALRSMDRAVALLRDLGKRQPDHPGTRLSLRNAHIMRAFALGQLDRHRDAVAAWDEVIRLETRPQMGHTWRLRRAEALVHGGQYVRAAEAARQVAGFDLPAQTLYDLACVLSLSAAAGARDATRPLPARDKDAGSWAREAVGLLERARRAGFFKNPSAVARMRKDSDLDFLRSRDDFRAWLKRLGGT